MLERLKVFLPVCSEDSCIGPTGRAGTWFLSSAPGLPSQTPWRRGLMHASG